MVPLIVALDGVTDPRNLGAVARSAAAFGAHGMVVPARRGAGDTPIRDLDLATAPLALVISSEGRGLSRIVAQSCDVLVRILIAARTESLNAGVAAGIALYEVAAIRSRATASG